MTEAAIRSRSVRFAATASAGEVTALVERPAHAVAMLVLAHGAGAGMRHPFMEAIARELARGGLASFRYQFPYMERGSRRPDHRPILLATVRSAVSAAAKEAGDLPLLAGGKSMGGRMTSTVAAEAPLPKVRGLVFFGFPLHPAGRPSTDRADHLGAVEVPMLFVQGTRDRLADPDLLTPIVTRLGDRARLHVIAGGDHSFHVLKRSGRRDEEVLAEIADATADWALSLGDLC